MRALWPRYTFVPIAVFVGWPIYCTVIGERRWELAIIAILGGVMPYVGPRGKQVFLGILPLGLVAFLYDSMRFVKNVGLSPETIHVCDLRNLEMQWFGIRMDGKPATIHDWVQAHPSLPLDVISSVPYGTFLGVAFLFAIFLYFMDYSAMRRFTAAFFATNVLAFITYHLYPAAPPWYFHAHGCIADLATRASEGPNLARVDAWLGVRYFGGFYGRSNDVFGAMPSLHVAYPLLMVLEGYRPFGLLRPWQKWALRLGSIVFFLWMCAAAVYLDHHWVLDIVCGCLYTLVVFVAIRAVRFFALARGDAGIEDTGREPIPKARPESTG
jgi:membrane-associated phospholipid phosphatase